MSREAMSEQLSIREGVGYDEVFPLSHEPDEGLSWSLKRETSAQSFDEEVESRGVGDEIVGEGEDEDDEGEGERKSDGDENVGDEEVLESTLGSPGDDHSFILPKKWTVNDFLLTMSDKVFKTLRGRYQILNNERCYSGITTDVGTYDAMFAVGLRLPLMAFHRQLANFLRFSVNQIAPNTWRIFIGAEIL